MINGSIKKKNICSMCSVNNGEDIYDVNCAQNFIKRNNINIINVPEFVEYLRESVCMNCESSLSFSMPIYETVIYYANKYIEKGKLK